MASSSHQPPIIARKSALKIGLCGFFGYGNLGNSAIQRAMISNIRKRLPDAEIFGFSLNPEDTQIRHGIPSYSIVRRPNPAAQIAEGSQLSADRPATAHVHPVADSPEAPPRNKKGFKAWLKSQPTLFNALKTAKKPFDNLQVLWDEFVFCRKCLQILKGFDVFILSGGGAIDETWGGAWKTPYITLRWATLARLAGLKFLVMSVGVERLDGKQARFFVRRAMRLASYRSFRDTYSQAFVQKICGCDGLMVPDLAFSLEIDPALEPEQRQTPPRPSNLAGVVGISPMDYLDPRSWPRKDGAKYQQYISTLAAFTEWLIARGYAVRFFPSDIYMDRLAILDVMAHLKASNKNYSCGQVREERVAIAPELVQNIAACDFAVASRFHGVVLSHRMGTPVMALSYDPKVNRLMDAFGLNEYCFRIEDLKLDEMIRTFEALEKNQTEVRNQVANVRAGYRDLLQNQYDRIFLS
jgi:polysaccharide pyruvyl transferase WcaK-like protein